MQEREREREREETFRQEVLEVMKESEEILAAARRNGSEDIGT